MEDPAASSDSSSWVFPLLLSCLAGASTCVGAAVVFCFEPSKIRKSMAFSLSLAAAVMVTISIISILPEVFGDVVVREKDLRQEDGNTNLILLFHDNYTVTVLNYYLLVERLFFFGIGVAAYLILAKLLVFLPDPEHMYLLDDPGESEDYKRSYDLYLSSDDGSENTSNSNNSGGDDTNDKQQQLQRMERGGMEDTSAIHESNSNAANNKSSSKKIRRRKNVDRGISHDTLASNGAEDEEDLTAFTKERRKRSWRVALMLFASLLIHNFPEGLCVAASAKESPELGITVAIGIFIHNVPEGIAISVPCIAAKPDQPWLAFWLASFSGLAEPLGAAVALTMLGKTKLDLENVLAFVAGVMIIVALWELYPEAFKANDEDLRHSRNYQTLSRRNNRKNNIDSTPLSWKNALPRLLLRREYRSILWGSIVGTILMVVTELYLP